MAPVRSHRLRMLLALAIMLASIFNPLAQETPSVSAAPPGVGMFPDSIIESCDTMGDGLSLASVPIKKLSVAIGVDIGISKLVDVCKDISTGRSQGYADAYDEAEAAGVFPGVPEGRVHFWMDYQIQDFRNGSRGDGWGAIMWGTGQPKPFYIGGDTWKAYNRAVYDYDVVPGYPTSTEQLWSGVPIQFFEGGSWGNGAIVGGDNGAWLITGNHWNQYWNVDGWSSLGAPRSFVYQNSEGKYQQDFEKGNITELAGQTWVHYNNTPTTSAQDNPPAQAPPAASQANPPAEAPPAASQNTPPQTGAPVCGDAGIPQATTRLSASPANPTPGTTVTLSVTITNNGCGTFAPEVLAIGGRDPAGNVTDPLQSREFVLGPGESRTITQPVVLSTPGTHEFFMVFLRVNGGWNRIPDSSGDTSSIYVNVSGDAGETAPPPSTAACSDNGMLHASSRLSASPENPTTTTEITLSVTLTNSSCGTYTTAVLAIGGRDPAGNVTDPLQIPDFVIGPGESRTITQPVVLTTPGTHEFFMAYLRVNGGWHRIPDASGDSASIYVNVSEAAPAQPDAPAPTDVPAQPNVTDPAGNVADDDIIAPIESTTEPPAPAQDSQPVDIQAGDGEVSQVPNQTSTDSGTADIALITRDPAGGKLLTGTCYELVNYSNQGCDENGDGQVTFADIPFGTYTVRQTRTPAGYPTINDFEINVTGHQTNQGRTASVPLGFIVKQATEQHTDNTRNISVVFLDAATYQPLATGACVQLIGASNVGCDEDLIDGQVDFLDVPAGGPYELSLTNLQSGYQLMPAGGPLTVTVNASATAPTTTHVFVLLTSTPDSSGGVIAPVSSGSSQTQQTSPATTSTGNATLLMTMRGCPEGFNPNVDDYFASCTIPLDAPDAAILYHGGDGQGGMAIMWMERQYDGAYIFRAGPSTMNVELSGLAPVVRDSYTVIGSDSASGDTYIVNLVDGETREVYVFYYYAP